MLLITVLPSQEADTSKHAFGSEAEEGGSDRPVVLSHDALRPCQCAARAAGAQRSGGHTAA